MQPIPLSSSRLIHGDCQAELKELAAASIDCCVTSPPYWGLRDYGVKPSVWGGSSSCPHIWQSAVTPSTSGAVEHANRGETPNARSATHFRRASESCPRCGAWRGALGLEPTPELYVEHLVSVFAEVWRVLKDHGTLWLNLGDCYAGSWGNYHPHSPPGKHGQRLRQTARWTRRGYASQEFLPPTATAVGRSCLKRKDLVGMPWRVALALQASGWYLRSDVVWFKPNCMPESVRDRPTRAHEFIFLLAKQPRYFYDADAIAEPLAAASLTRLSQASFHRQRLGPKDYGQGTNRNRSARRALVNLKERMQCPQLEELVRKRAHASGSSVPYAKDTAQQRHGASLQAKGMLRNKRSVWTIPTTPFRGAHFATFPPQLVRNCVRAGCPRGGTVLDPFMGAGTVGLVCQQEERGFLGIEQSRDYVTLATERIRKAGRQ